MLRRNFLHCLSSTGLFALGLKPEPVTGQLYLYAVKPVRRYYSDSLVVAESAEAASLVHPHCSELFWDGQKWDLDHEAWVENHTGWLKRLSKVEALEVGTWYWEATELGDPDSRPFVPSVDRVLGCLGPVVDSYQSHTLVYGENPVNTPAGRVPTKVLLEVLKQTGESPC